MEIKIDKRFCGPSFSGHGGYTCGMLAHNIKGSAEVTLLKPIPLQKNLSIENSPDESCRLMDDGIVIATAQPLQFEIAIPAPPTFAEAVKASRNYIGLSEAYLYPNCFCCGKNRQPGDGLRIFPGKPDGNNFVAAPWTTEDWLQDESGEIKCEFIWAALDCPGGIACMGDEIRPLLLGRFAAQIIAYPKANQRCMVTGWQSAQEGRKHFAGSALFSEEGKLLAYGRATWIEPRPQ